MPLVTMTHEDLPGVEQITEQLAYRYVWFPEGWRSEDDPDWDGVPPAEPNDTHFRGTVTYAASPLVPNPADVNPLSAVSLGELEQRIEESSAGFVRSLNPKTSLSPVISNSTSELSLLDATFSMPMITHEAVFRLVATGVCRCTAGGPVDITLRLKNTTDGATFVSAAVSLATDTQGNRPWRFEVVGEGNTFLAASVMSVGSLIVGAGNTDTLKQALAQAIVDDGSDPQTWDLTAQASVANAGIQVYPYSAQLMYALPGA